MADITVSGKRGDMRHVVARLERLPYCSWHLKMRLIICTAWFFDAFDSIAIAYVLPPLIGLWHMTPQQIGSLIGIGFAGQLVGAVGFGWLAERWGRRLCMLITLLRRYRPICRKCPKCVRALLNCSGASICAAQ